MDDSKRLPIEEIEKLYPAHWFLINEPEVDARNSIVSGIVLFAEKEKDEVYRKAVGMKLKSIALRCTKPPSIKKYVPWFTISNPETASSR